MDDWHIVRLLPSITYLHIHDIYTKYHEDYEVCRLIRVEIIIISSYTSFHMINSRLIHCQIDSINRDCLLNVHEKIIIKIG